MHHLKITYARAISLCCALFLSGCGLDDTNYLSGTVSAGAPIIGTVTLKDSSVPPIEKSVTIRTDGTYIIEVTDLISPFMLRADGVVGGRAYSLYSAATATDVGGNINVTPLTDLIVANVVAEIPTNYYIVGDFSNLTPANLNTAETAMQVRLQSILTEIGLGNVDLLRTPFSPDHTGLDAVLDILRVTFPDAANATIKNIITGQVITDDLAVTDEADELDLAIPDVVSRIAVFQQIVAVFDSLSDAFSTSLPSNILSLFDAALLDDGRDRATFHAALISDNTLIGAKFTNVVLESFTPSVVPSGTNPTSAKVRLSLVRATGHIEPLEFTLNKVPGSWLIAGNQHIAKVNVSSFARSDKNNIIATGLTLGIEDIGGKGIDYAVVTGNGLPNTLGGANGASAGLLLFNTGSGTFQLAASGVGAAYNGTSTSSLTGDRDHYPMIEDSILNIADNDTYKVVLWNDNGTSGLGELGDDTPMATYDNILVGKQPYIEGVMPSSAFAAITTAGSIILSAAISNGPLTLDWTLPAGLRSDKIRFWRSYSSSPSDEIVQYLVGTATSTQLVIPSPTGTVVTVGIDLHARDVFNREIITYTEY